MANLMSMDEATRLKYFKIRLNSLLASEPIPFDLYLWINNHMLHYTRSGDHMSTGKLDKFESKAPDSFYVLQEDRQKYKDYIHGLVENKEIPIETRAKILRESSFSLVEELFENPDVGKALEASKKVISSFLDIVEEEPAAMSHLIGLSSHDFYTYTHSLDVAIYGLGLGRMVGYSGQELQILGEGSLFHDIGKRNVSVDIICKEGPLDDVEWAEMQRHPQYGLMILNEYDYCDAIKACCLEHHESALGNGYPQALPLDEVHPMARIVALTDTFDALTTKRSYNVPMTPGDALNFMTEKLSKRFDPDLLKAMVNVLFKVSKDLAV